MTDTIYTPLAPSAAPADCIPAPLPPKDEKMFEETLAHFSKPGYTITGLDTEKGQLTDEEKFWLVRFLQQPLPFNRHD